MINQDAIDLYQNTRLNARRGARLPRAVPVKLART